MVFGLVRLLLIGKGVVWRFFHYEPRNGEKLVALLGRIISEFVHVG